MGRPGSPGSRRPDFAFDRALAGELERHAPVAAGASVLEIGCAPAKWLVFYAERFGAAVEGVEYSEKGAELSRANLAACGVEGTILQEDFFAMEPRPFDLVLTFGFIEHFEELGDVFARHVEFMKPGGRMALTVPNFRGINRFTQAVADRDYLHRHNAKAMEPDLYRRIAAEHGLELERLSHFGGFDPSIIRIHPELPLVHPKRLLPTVITYAEHRWRRTARAEHVDHRWLSSGLIAFMRRPG